MGSPILAQRALTKGGEAAGVLSDWEVMRIHHASQCQGVETGVFACMCVHLALGGMSQGSGGLWLTHMYSRLRPGGSFLQLESGQRNQGAAESVRIQLEFQELLPDLGEVAAGPLLLCWQKWQLPTQGSGEAGRAELGPEICHIPVSLPPHSLCHCPIISTPTGSRRPK